MRWTRLDRSTSAEVRGICCGRGRCRAGCTCRHGTRAQHVGESCFTLGLLCHLMGLRDEAVTLLGDAHAVYVHLLGVDHSVSARAALAARAVA